MVWYGVMRWYGIAFIVWYLSRYGMEFMVSGMVLIISRHGIWYVGDHVMVLHYGIALFWYHVIVLRCFCN